MSDDEKSDVAKTAASRILDMIPADTREMIGEFYGIFLFVAAPAVIGIALYAAFQFANSLSKEDAPCWDLKTINNTIYKINRCTGQTEIIKTGKEQNITDKVQ